MSFERFSFGSKSNFGKVSLEINLGKIYLGSNFGAGAMFLGLAPSLKLKGSKSVSSKQISRSLIVSFNSIGDFS